MTTFLSDLIARGQDRRSNQQALLQALTASQGPGGLNNPGGDFNASHEGPGAGGLTFGVQDPYYSSRARSLYELVEQKFPQVSLGGIFNPRNIRGTNTPSEHAYGAAVDLMVGSNRLGDQIYQFLNRPRIQNRFGYSNVLWEVPDHFNHLHAGWLY